MDFYDPKADKMIKFVCNFLNLNYNENRRPFMTKNLKLSYILYLTFFAIIIAFNTISNFFSGVGISFIGLVGILTTLIILVSTDKTIWQRTREIFLTVCVMATLEFIIFFVLEYGIGDVKTWQVFAVIQNVFSFISLLFFAYVVFRFIMEMKDIRVRFVEIILGNASRKPKVRKAKELTNGCLEDKPKNTHTIHEDTDPQDIIVEDEE